MVLYEFKCKKCKRAIPVKAVMAEGPPEDVTCTKCGNIAHRVWGNSTIRIPEYMKANTDDVSPTAVKNRLNKVRPTGKTKTYW